MGEQGQWHFCQNCSSMFFGGQAVNAGACIAGGPHIAQGFEFTLPFADGPETPNTQKDWFFCRNCNCLFFVPVGGNAGTCGQGGGHDSTGSFNFHLPHDIPEAPGNQAGWRFCRKCSVLFFSGNPGKCVKGGGHDGTGSFNFVLRHGGTFIRRSGSLEDDTDLIPVRE